MISSIGKIVLKKSISYCNKAKNYYICALKHGKVSEWSNEQSWKDCIRDDCIEGSNPSLSAKQTVFNAVKNGLSVLSVIPAPKLNRKLSFLRYFPQVFLCQLAPNSHGNIRGMCSNNEVLRAELMGRTSVCQVRCLLAFHKKLSSINFFCLVSLFSSIFLSFIIRFFK